MDFTQNLIHVTKSTREALQLINQLPNHLTLFVVDDQSKLLGTVTDGDIRRGLLSSKSIEAPVSEFMYSNFRYLKNNDFSLTEIRALKKLKIHLIPILNDADQIIRIVNLKEKKSLLPLDAVIMAGGRGSRLRPLTDQTPKPLLKVGEKPIIEHNIDRLNDFGVHDLTISVRYLGEQIEDYFKDGSEKGIRINYVYEEEPLGTMGALSLISGFKNDYVLVMNSDLLTDINFEELYLELSEKGGDMIVASHPYEVNVPYGVLESNGDVIVQLKEKPTYTYYANAGIYLFKKELISLVPKGEFFDAPHFIDLLIQKDKKVMHYPILGYWLDIGKHNDYEKAQRDIKHIQL
ncbi:MAG: nucleotidyltransferase family protein [Bacteroidota bacterium]